jgi:hypothetical protein
MAFLNRLKYTIILAGKEEYPSIQLTMNVKLEKIMRIPTKITGRNRKIEHLHNKNNPNFR